MGYNIISWFSEFCYILIEDFLIFLDSKTLIKSQFLTRVGYLTFCEIPMCPEFSLGLALFSFDRKKREDLGKILEHLHEEVPVQRWQEVIEIINQLITGLP